MRGGLQQQLRRGRGATRPARNSTLAVELLMKWCWGFMSLPTLQLLAAAGVEDGIDIQLLRLTRLMSKSVEHLTLRQNNMGEEVQMDGWNGSIGATEDAFGDRVCMYIPQGSWLVLVLKADTRITCTVM